MSSTSTTSTTSGTAIRREQILAASTTEFARHGLRGASVKTIAAQVGVSEAYVYKLFGTKHDLFLAALRRVRDRVAATFIAAAATNPTDPLGAMGRAYDQDHSGCEEHLLLLQGFAASAEPVIRTAMATGYADLWRTVRVHSDATEQELFAFFATGMLLTVEAVVGFLALVATDKPDAAPS